MPEQKDNTEPESDRDEAQSVRPAFDGPTEAAERTAEEVNRLREQLLRARADYANLQKRHARDREAFRFHALQDFVRTLLPGLDDLERALKAEAGDIDALRSGVRMALETLHRALRDAGVEPVATDGVPFDPAIHEALVVETAQHLEEPTVAEEIRAGYTLGERLVRPAQVRVLVPPEDRGRAEGAADAAPSRPEQGGPDADV
jgi:molecular chaperone GrpE